MIDRVVSQPPAPELLSPAGDWDAMRAAVANGADAVYFGLENFNARHRAQNFTLEELPNIMRYLHAHNTKGFLTFNTLIFSDELEAAAKSVEAIASAGVDAVIVQDIGLVRLIHAIAPTLPIHGSTQMTLTEPRGIEFIRAMGVSRVVLARELSIEDISRIRAGTPMELEVFVHGALCVAYSGQCLTSEALGGRSANRGQCAQACRLPYELIVDGQTKDLGDRAYLLSPQDLAAYDLVGDLSTLGVSCFKIEGRLKAAHYVAATTQTYRQAIDSFRERSTFRISPQQRADLEQTFSRGFTHGFLSGVNHQQLVAARFPKSRGRRMGVVARLTPRSIVVKLDGAIAQTDLKPGDGIVFDEGHPEQDEQGGRVYHLQPQGRERVEIELKHGEVNLRAIALGAIVWKTDDPALRKRLEHSFSRETVVNRIPLIARVTARTSEPLRVELIDEDRSVAVESDAPLQAAQKFPITNEVLRDQIGRLGDTPFELDQLHAEIVGSPMVPKSVLNDLRRKAVSELIALREQRSSHGNLDISALESLRKNARDFSRGSSSNVTAHLHVLVRTLDQLDAALSWSTDDCRLSTIYCDFEDVRRYKEAVARCRAANMPVALATLRVVKPHEHGTLKQILDCEPDALLVRNLAAVSYYRDAAPHLPQIGDYSLNIANELTARVFTEAGLARMVPSYDLNWQQMSAMLSRSDPSRFECVVHQHMPMFHMEHCVFAHTLSSGKDYRDCGRPCDRHQVDLRHTDGLAHPLIPDVGCRNTLFNATAQSAAEYIPKMRELGIRHFRVELLRERSDDVAPLLDRYAAVLSGKSDPHATMRSLRVLNQLGVTRGTLDRE
ncbi:MAG: U32 family peptidase [Anaerolineae bacterium]|nr:U32 family peptidase [Phycisphaerae bacterium]